MQCTFRQSHALQAAWFDLHICVLETVTARNFQAVALSIKAAGTYDTGV